MKTNHAEEYDPLDALLRESVSHVEDGDFTARVFSGLPRRRPFRPALLLGSAAIGLVMAAFWLPWESCVVVDHQTLQSTGARVLLSWLMPFSVVACLTLAITEAIQGDQNFPGLSPRNRIRPAPKQEKIEVS